MRTTERPENGGEQFRVAFKRHIRPVVVPGEAVYLLSDHGVTAARGATAEALAPLLDGSRSLAQVLAEASGTVPRHEAREAVDALTGAGLVAVLDENSPQPADRAGEAYWDLAGLDGRKASHWLRQTAVRIVVLDGVTEAQAAAACRESGLRLVGDPVPADGGTLYAPPALTTPAFDAPADTAATVEGGASPALSLVFCADYLDPRLAEVDREHRAAGIPWLLAKPGGADPWIGPVFRPQDGPCWNCLADRLRRNRRSEQPLRRALGMDSPLARPESSLAAGRTMGLHAAVLEAAKWLAGVRRNTQDAILVLETLGLGGGKHHPVHRRPQCTACGDPGLVGARIRAPFRVTSQPKADLDGNGHRALTAEQMLERHRHLVSPVTGVVRELRRAPRSPAFLHACLSGPNLALDPENLDGLRAGLRALSGGKGLNDTEARVGALCEAVERYSATRHGDEPVVRDTFRALGELAIHPNACQLYSEQQFAERSRWNAANSPFHYVSERFDENAVRDWTPIWSLTEQRHRLLPTSMLYFSGVDRDPGGLRADSNGNAAGSSLEDALLQGTLELVERDAVALWWYNRTRQPAVDLEAFAEPWLERLRAGYRSVNREVWALDLTSDLGIPTVVALSRRTDKPSEDVLFGFGAHFDPAIALRRAMTEMGQLLPAVLDAGPDGTGYAVPDPHARVWWRHATAANQPYLLPDPELPALAPDPAGHRPRPDLADDIAELTRTLGARGLDLLVLDQTRPDIGLPVVKAVVPGLRPFWSRFAPGRLFDAPVAAGRRDEPLPYQELNPVSIFV
ncbi:TOMM precursor leader peptide-binding protein [Streptacidiphilus jiangxiensis]|uniref:Ribosomal protein S12 methylthiotransferase accessory factor n=1 Tax=Streptacidiphilus jiangxiensis TaxID=235985 RepID=A0A1H7JR69_STRJI|nr:TOMM precursor leader peptide-binding protein [Streptacidiphilus jiangxiensis]SEK75955.1 ribosomal protein S12 methylthiotransferase accessory factor [Streptacidiphilus jiangxiensis]